MLATFGRWTHVGVVRVVVADDDARVRESLVDVLGMDRRFEVVGAADSGDALAELVGAGGVDLVVLDVRMPGGGPEGVQTVRSAGPPGEHLPVVVGLSAQSDAGTVAQMLRAGAAGYLVKGHVGADLPDMLARCAAGEVVLAVGSGAEALRGVVEDL